MYIILITIIGLILRLVNIDKPEGLWNDEYVSWLIASTPFNNGFFSAILKQCHLPLYYFYLKPFASCSDVVLRLTSTIPSIISIYVMYLIGKEYSNKKGFICATITAILSFLIYYAQEVRFYSLLFLFSALSLLFLIRLCKSQKGWKGFIISSLLILFTHALGGIYVGINCFYLAYKKKKLTSKLILFFVLSIILIVPFGTNILKMLPTSQWWGEFSYTNILFLFSDYFSPILTNNINAPKTFIYSKDLLLNTFLIFPTILSIFCIIRGFKKQKGLGLIVFGTIFITMILAISGIIVFITKYTIEILPILILLFTFGLEGKLENYLLSIFIIFHILTIFTPYYPAKIFREEGHRLVADILNKTNPDKIIYTYYEPNRFDRYLKINPKTDHISKINRFDYINTPINIKKDLKSGEIVSVVFLDSVSFIPEDKIEIAKKQGIPEMFITFSSIRYNLIKELSSGFTEYDVQKKGSWIIITARKK